MPTSALKLQFLRYNDQWFDGALPTTTRVKWGNMKEMGYTLGDEIAINRALRPFESAWRLTLLHEMAHLATATETAEHGKRWLRLMHSLARRGAFDALW